MEEFIKENFGELMAVTVLAVWKKIFPEKKEAENQNHGDLVHIAKENTLHLKEIKENVGDIKTDITILKAKQER